MRKPVCLAWVLMLAIPRRFPKLPIIGAHLGNPGYTRAAEMARWNPDIYFALSVSTLIKKQDDHRFFKSIFRWSGTASPHRPQSGAHASELITMLGNPQ